MRSSSIKLNQFHLIDAQKMNVIVNYLLEICIVRNFRRRKIRVCNRNLRDNFMASNLLRKRAHSFRPNADFMTVVK